MLSAKHATLVLICTSSVILSACGTGEASVAEQADAVLPIPVEVAYPERESISAIYKLSAPIKTELDAPAVAKVAGDVIVIDVEEGEHVRAGQILARLDGERLKLEMLSAKADLERAEREYARNQDLNRRGLISASMYDGMKFEMDALKARYDLAALLYDDSNIRAPISGVVAERTIKLGQNMRVNDQAFRIANTNELVSYLKIPQSELNKFSAGNLITLRVASLPQTEFIAEVARISPTIDTANGTFRVTAKIDNTVGLLAPGMFAQFSIAFEEHEDALVIPAAAVVQEDTESVVYIVKKNTVSRRVITTGIATDEMVEVISGLDADERVVVVGQSSLSEGTQVLAQATTSDRHTG